MVANPLNQTASDILHADPLMAKEAKRAIKTSLGDSGPDSDAFANKKTSNLIEASPNKPEPSRWSKFKASLSEFGEKAEGFIKSCLPNKFNSMSVQQEPPVTKVSSKVADVETNAKAESTFKSPSQAQQEQKGQDKSAPPSEDANSNASKTAEPKDILAEQKFKPEVAVAASKLGNDI